MTTHTAAFKEHPSFFRTHRFRRMRFVAVFSLLAFVAAGYILLPDNNDDFSRAAPIDEQRQLPYRASVRGSPLSPSSPPLTRGINGTAHINGDVSGIRGPGSPRRNTVRTFYSPIPGFPASQHEEQVALWTQAWSTAGWDARVLTLDDARRHPRYAELMEKIDALDWCAPDGESRAVDFQKMCFVRWLAYSADGAGYVSDYDVLPLNFALIAEQGRVNAEDFPNSGVFTAYDPILSSFASAGSGEEFERILTAMLDAADEHRKPRRPIDNELGPAGRRTRGMECPASPADSGVVGTEVATKWQITDMQALQVVKFAMWKGSLPPGTLHVPAIKEKDRPPCSLVLNEKEFEIWTIAHPKSCPGAVHFSGKPGMERDERLELSVAMWDAWRDLCRKRTECALLGDWESQKQVRKRRGVVLNLAAGASILATVVAAMG